MNAVRGGTVTWRPQPWKDGDGGGGEPLSDSDSEEEDFPDDSTTPLGDYITHGGRGGERGRERERPCPVKYRLNPPLFPLLSSRRVCVCVCVLGLKQLLDAQQLCDVTLLVEGKKFMCHRYDGGCNKQKNNTLNGQVFIKEPPNISWKCVQKRVSAPPPSPSLPPSLQSPVGGREPLLPGHVHQPSGGVPPHRDPAGGSDAVRHGDRHPVRVHRRGGALPGHGRGSVRGRQPAPGHAPPGPVLQVSNETPPTPPLYLHLPDGSWNMPTMNYSYTPSYSLNVF